MKLKKTKARNAIVQAMSQTSGWLSFADCYDIANGVDHWGCTRSQLGNLLAKDSRFVRLTRYEVQNDSNEWYHTRDFIAEHGYDGRGKSGSIWALAAAYDTGRWSS